MSVGKAGIGAALEALNLPVNEDTIDQLAVFTRALEIYVERETRHGGTWKEFDAGDAAHHCQHKAARMQHAVSHGGSDRGLDSAYDICNYGAFYVRHSIGAK